MSKCHIVGNHMPRLVTDAKFQEASTLEIDVLHLEQEEDPHFCASKFKVTPVFCRLFFNDDFNWKNKTEINLDIDRVI